MKRVQRPDTNVLQPGDTIEYGLTVETKVKGLSYWPKIVVTGKIKEGESADQAVERITTFVHEQLGQVVQAL